MRLRKIQPDAPRYSEGLRTRLRDSTRRPQDERISESAKAISIEMITVLSSNTEIVQAPARPNGSAFSGVRQSAEHSLNTRIGLDYTTPQQGQT